MVLVSYSWLSPKYSCKVCHQNHMVFDLKLTAFTGLQLQLETKSVCRVTTFGTCGILYNQEPSQLGRRRRDN